MQGKEYWLCNFHVFNFSFNSLFSCVFLELFIMEAVSVELNVVSGYCRIYL